jgi:hypothetical protein
MRHVRECCGWAALALLLAACTSTPFDSESLLHLRGTISSGCSPRDASSMILRLESRALPGWVFVSLWPSGGVAIPGVSRFGADGAAGQGGLCTDSATCDLATWGEVRFERSTGDGKITGEVKLGWDDGRTLRGSFEADWLAIQALCG